MERKKKPVGQAVESTFTPEASIVDALQPTQQEIPAPAAEASAEVANPYLELLRKRQKDASDEATFTAVASGLGALFSGDAAGPITEYGVSQIGNRIKRKEALEDQEQNYLLAQMKAKNTANGGKEWQQAKFELQDKATGQITSIMGRFNQRTGEYSDLSGNPLDTRRYDISPAYKFDIKTDPTTKELGRFGQRGGGERVATQGFGQSKLTEKQKSIFRGAEEKLNKNPVFKDARSTFNAATRASEYLASENPIADAGMPVVFARMFGEVGNLAVQEQAKFEGSRAIERMYDRLKFRLQEGLLTEEDRADLLEVAKVTEAYSQKLIDQEVERLSQSESMLGDIEQGDLRKYLGVYKEKPVTTGKISKEGQRRMRQTVGDVVTAPDGRKFKRIGPNKYVPIER